MKLKEKFIGYCDHQYASREDNAEYCVEIADDYAIEFAEWIKNDWACNERWSKITDSKELLQIFKKEKGL